VPLFLAQEDDVGLYEASALEDQHRALWISSYFLYERIKVQSLLISADGFSNTAFQAS
jgi:hypothetical protein